MKKRLTTGMWVVGVLAAIVLGTANLPGHSSATTPLPACTNVLKATGQPCDPTLTTPSSVPVTTPSSVPTSPTSPTTPSTTPVTMPTVPTNPQVALTKDAVSALCTPKCDVNNMQLIEQGGGIHYDGPAVSVQIPSGYCNIDTPSGRADGPVDYQSVSVFTVRLCGTTGGSTSGGSNSTVASTTTVPSRANNQVSGPCDPRTLGGYWVSIGSNAWKLVTSGPTSVAIPSTGPSWVVDEPFGSITNGQSVTVGAATAYCFA